MKRVLGMAECSGRGLAMTANQRPMPSNSTNRASFLEKSGDPRLPYVRAGYEDVRTGRPFDYAFVDRAAASALGKSYEFGRLMALTALLAGWRVPAWGKTDPIPRSIRPILKLFQYRDMMEEATGRPRNYPIADHEVVIVRKRAS